MFVLTNYPPLINVKKKQSKWLHLSNYIEVKLCGLRSKKR